MTWPELQNLFRQRYSKLGNTCEQLNYRFLCNVNKTGSNTLRLWRTTGIGSIQKHTSNKIVLDTVSNRILETSSRDSKKNTNQRKVR